MVNLDDVNVVLYFGIMFTCPWHLELTCYSTISYAQSASVCLYGGIFVNYITCSD